MNNIDCLNSTRDRLLLYLAENDIGLFVHCMRSVYTFVIIRIIKLAIHGNNSKFVTSQCRWYGIIITITYKDSIVYHTVCTICMWSVSVKWKAWNHKRGYASCFCSPAKVSKPSIINANIYNSSHTQLQYCSLHIQNLLNSLWNNDIVIMEICGVSVRTMRVLL